MKICNDYWRKRIAKYENCNLGMKSFSETKATFSTKIWATVMMSAILSTSKIKLQKAINKMWKRSNCSRKLIIDLQKLFNSCIHQVICPMKVQTWRKYWSSWMSRIANILKIHQLIVLKKAIWIICNFWWLKNWKV